MTELKGTIIRRIIRGKERFYHQWREDGKTKSRYLKPAEVMPLREQLRTASRPRPRRPQAPSTSTSTFTSTSPLPLFSSGVIIGLRLKELTADAKRLTPRELLPDILGTDPARTGPVPLCLLFGAPGTGKTTLLKHVILTFSDDKLKESAYFSLPATLTAPELLADLKTLFDCGIRNFFLDGIDRSPALAGTIPVLNDLYPSRGARLYLTSTAPSTTPSTSTSNLNLISTTRISFRDFCAMSRTDDLDAYLASRGLAAEIAAHEPTSRHLGAAARKMAREKIRRELTEAKLREVIREEMRLRRTTPTTEVVVPELASGGVDLIVVDHEELTCELYEIRYASERNDRQIARLESARNLDAIEHLYGMITTREVLYLGRNAWHHNGIFYRNAAAYLRGGESKWSDPNGVV